METTDRFGWLPPLLLAATLLCGNASPVAAQRNGGGPAPGPVPSALLGDLPTQVVGPSVTLIRPIVLNTSQLQSGQMIISLFGIQGYSDAPAAALQAYIDFAGQLVTCQAQNPQGYVCVMPDGNDIAAMALANGDARTTADAPDFYRQLEAGAQAGQRGIWRGASSGNPVNPQSPANNILSGGDNPDNVVPADVGAPYGADGPVVLEPQVFLVLGPNGAGWGYYDQGRQWHPVGSGGGQAVQPAASAGPSGNDPRRPAPYQGGQTVGITGQGGLGGGGGLPNTGIGAPDPARTDYNLPTPMQSAPPAPSQNGGARRR